MSNATKGENNPRATISEEMARNIKLRLVNMEKPKDISEQMDVKISIIYGIKSLNSWKHLDCHLNEYLLLNKEIHTVTLSEDIVKEIKILLSNGETNQNISNKLNIKKNHIENIKSLRTYKNILSELNNNIQNNIQQKYNILNEEIASNIKIMLANGCSNETIINKLKVSKNSVSKIKHLKNWINVLPNLNEIIRNIA